MFHLEKIKIKILLPHKFLLPWLGVYIYKVQKLQPTSETFGDAGPSLAVYIYQPNHSTKHNIVFNMNPLCSNHQGVASSLRKLQSNTDNEADKNSCFI